MREIEIEFKNLLSEEQYLTLFKKYDLKNSEEIVNKNFYYDDADESFKKIGAALRIRYTNKKIEMTLKIKEKMPKTMTLINCVPTRMTRIKNYVPNQKTTHVETIALMSRK